MRQAFLQSVCFLLAVVIMVCISRNLWGQDAQKNVHMEHADTTYDKDAETPLEETVLDAFLHENKDAKENRASEEKTIDLRKTEDNDTETYTGERKRVGICFSDASQFGIWQDIFSQVFQEKGDYELFYVCANEDIRAQQITVEAFLEEGFSFILLSPVTGFSEREEFEQLKDAACPIILFDHALDLEKTGFLDWEEWRP